MSGWVIEGYAMVSADGMLADSTGIMPDKLKIDADQEFFQAALDRSDIVVHGRKSWDEMKNSASRKRLVVTRSVAALKQHPEQPNLRFWNPAGLSFDDALTQSGVTQGSVAILGGTDIFDMFLGRYDLFWLSQTTLFTLPDGVPVFAGVPLRTPQAVLASHGYQADAPLLTDAAQALTITAWRKG